MIEAADVARIAEEVAREKLGVENVVRALAEPWVDLDGDDAWRVTIVVEPDAVDPIGGAAILDNLVSIHERLRQRDDQRLPFVQFATEEELQESGSSES